jgi:hypothetical protein
MDQLRLELASDFRLYLQFVLDYQGFKAGESQLEIADHLQCGAPGVGVLACRGASKTTIASTHYVNWRHLRCPDLRVLVISGVDDRAGSLAKQLCYNYKTLPWLTHLAPKRASSERTFDLKGARKEPSPSVNSLSVHGKATGLRADLVILDDAQMVKDVSDVRYEEILSQIDDFTNILRSPDTQPWFSATMPENAPERTQMVVVGNYHDVENDILTPPEDPEIPHFMRDVKVKRWPALVPASAFDKSDGVRVLTAKGDGDKEYAQCRWKSNFPEILPTNYLLEKKAKLSKAQWALQYMLDKSRVPGPEDAVLNMEAISSFAYDKPDVVAGIKNWYVVIDPADKGGDYFVAAEVAPWQGKLYVRHIDAWTKTDSAQCIERVVTRIIDQKNRNKTAERSVDDATVKRIYFESSFSAMGSLIKAKLVDLGERTIGVEPIHNREGKLARTINTLEPALNNGRMRLNKGMLVSNHLLRRQLQTLRQGSMPKPHDDLVDCLGFAYRVFENKLGSTGRASVTQFFAA